MIPGKRAASETEPARAKSQMLGGKFKKTDKVQVAIETLYAGITTNDPLKRLHGISALHTFSKDEEQQAVLLRYHGYMDLILHVIRHVTPAEEHGERAREHALCAFLNHLLVNPRYDILILNHAETLPALLAVADDARSGAAALRRVAQALDHLAVAKQNRPVLGLDTRVLALLTRLVLFTDDLEVRAVRVGGRTLELEESPVARHALNALRYISRDRRCLFQLARTDGLVAALCEAALLPEAEMHARDEDARAAERAEGRPAQANLSILDASVAGNTSLSEAAFAPVARPCPQPLVERAEVVSLEILLNLVRLPANLLALRHSQVLLDVTTEVAERARDEAVADLALAVVEILAAEESSGEAPRTPSDE
eukprot:gnl/Chilomastix_cuspidata/1051.p1 GENE.gnl/Chilomastix_cuspidata/1051~~gnl/Chilomastix_cuspidata/1051.p1  ORF type:complete len:370 (-),score=216.40 gnl/Chilomastix_cuspidata/1051:886-1995(-)